jgi:citrate lyase subunit beta/citryl-CoA lyase
MKHRSYLFVPGDSARKQAKALDSGADALIIDLEDSVTSAAKSDARKQTVAFLREPASMARLVRVNALDSGLTADDLAVVAPHGPDGYVMPKCEGPDDIARLVDMIVQAGGAPDAPLLVIATETARGLRRLMRMDWSHPNLQGLTWGAEDLSTDLGALQNRDSKGVYFSPFTLARDTALLAAKEAAVAAVDTVFTNIKDTTALHAEAENAFNIGFDGKMAIHPAQVPIIHAAFTPTPQQVDHAQRIVSTMSSAGVAQLDGRMIDQPHLLQAHRILDLHARSQAR